MCFGLVVVMTCTTGLPVYASNNKEISAMTGEISALTGEITNIETPTDSTINYTEQRQDGLYYITENVNGNTIESTIYKMEGEEKYLIPAFPALFKKDKLHVLKQMLMVLRNNILFPPI